MSRRTLTLSVLSILLVASLSPGVAPTLAAPPVGGRLFYTFLAIWFWAALWSLHY